MGWTDYIDFLSTTDMTLSYYVGDMIYIIEYLYHLDVSW